MSIALDVGAFQIRSLRRQGGKLRGRRCRTLMAVLPDSPPTVRVLHQSKIAYATCEKQLLVLGDDAAGMAAMLQTACQPLLPNGRLAADEPLARQSLAALIDAVLPDPDVPGEICCMTFPGAADPRLSASSPELEFLRRVLRLRGFAPRVLAAGAALCLSELVDQAFTGIGLSFGAAACQASVCHRGKELTGCSIPLGADQLDERVALELGEFCFDAAGNRSPNLETVRRRKESVENGIPAADDETGKLLARYYREWVGRVLGEVAETLGRRPELESLPRPMTVVIGGGSAAIPGFRNLVHETLPDVVFPVPIKELRVASDANFAVARGCLIFAELEAQGDGSLSRAA